MKNRDSAFRKEKTFNIVNPIIGTNTDGVFKLSKTSIDKYKSNLYTLIFTGVGERLMMPNFGTMIRNYLFEQLDDNTFEAIRTDIINKVSYWIPELVVNNVSFKSETADVENNIMNIRIDFSLKRDETIQDFIEIETRV